MKCSSYTLCQAEDDINKLIECDEIQYERGMVGRCNRYYLIFPDDQHKYYYNHNKSISKLMMEKVFTFIYTVSNMSKRLNKKNNCYL